MAMRKLMMMGMFLLLAGTASRANDLYVAQNAAGSATGTDCANAHPASWFNSSSSWGTSLSQIGSGDTVHLCGTIGTALTVLGNGSSGSPVTVLFETGAKLSEPACPSTGCLNLDNRSWIVVDGGGPGGTNGIIESTSNGTGLASQRQSVRGVQMDGATNITVKNLLIRNMYVHKVLPLDTAPSAPDPTAVHLFGSSNISIHDNSIHDANWAIFGGGGGNSVAVYNNDVFNVDHMVAIGVISNTSTGVDIYNNHFHDPANWDTSATACSGSSCYHHDGVHLFQTAGGSIKNVSIYNNLFDGDWGIYNTAQIYTEGVDFTMTVYNNVFLGTTNNRNLNNGAMCLTVGPNGTVKAYHNTVIGSSSQQNGLVKVEGASVDFRNNVVSGSSALIYLPSDVSFVQGGMDHNVWGGSGSPFYVCTSTCSFQSFSGFNSGLSSISGRGGSSVFTSNISLSASGVPQSGSVVAGVGANLSTSGIQPLNFDRVGSQRLAAAPAWDAGAYNVGGGSARPAAPSGLAVSVN
jgi:hypothetical protein